MAMDGVRSSLAALLFLTLVVLAASASSCGGDDAAAAVKDKQCHRPLDADEPYALVAFQFHNNAGEEIFHNNAGEEIRLLADQRSGELLSSGVTAFANRSGHWFYSGTGREEGKGSRRRRLVPLHTRSRAEGLWNKLRVLVTTDDGEELARYLLVGMQTSGGDKIRLVVVADQRYFFISGYAKGWFLPPNWFFHDGVSHRLLPKLGGGNGGGGSHAEVVASNVLAAMMKEGKALFG